jgi:excisionase family DNA binding protein
VNGRLLTAREVAETLGLSTETILEWVRRGDLPAFKLGRAIRFREDDLDQWLAERATSLKMAAGAAEEGEQPSHFRPGRRCDIVPQNISGPAT